MRKHLNNPWVSGALALLAAIFVTFSVWDGGSKVRPTTAVDQSLADAQHATDPLLEYEELGRSLPNDSAFDTDAVRALASLAASRDLFGPRVAPREATVEPAKQELASTTIRVKGIWIQGGIRYVVIDDRMLSPGQSIDRVLVQRIEPQGVWIDYASESHFIKPGESWSYEYAVPQNVAQN